MIYYDWVWPWIISFQTRFHWEHGFLFKNMYVSCYYNSSWRITHQMMMLVQQELHRVYAWEPNILVLQDVTSTSLNIGLDVVDKTYLPKQQKYMSFPKNDVRPYQIVPNWTGKILPPTGSAIGRSIPSQKCWWSAVPQYGFRTWYDETHNWHNDSEITVLELVNGFLRASTREAYNTFSTTSLFDSRNFWTLG